MCVAPLLIYIKTYGVVVVGQSKHAIFSLFPRRGFVVIDCIDCVDAQRCAHCRIANARMHIPGMLITTHSHHVDGGEIPSTDHRLHY